MRDLLGSYLVNKHYLLKKEKLKKDKKDFFYILTFTYLKNLRMSLYVAKIISEISIKKPNV